MAQDTLVKFSNAIMTDAEDKRREYIKKLEKENKELLKAKKEEYRAEYEKYVQSECARLSSSNGLEVAQRRNELKRELILQRKSMFDKIFAEVAANIAAYADTDEYREKTGKMFCKAAEGLLPGKIVCRARSCDIELLKNTGTGADVKFESADGKMLGGFTLENDERHLFLDCTLDAEIEKQKELFFVKSGLVIE